MSKFWSDRTRTLDPYVPGEQPQGRKFIKLNTNESPYPPSPKALAAIEQERNESLRLYPDPEATQLKQAIADFNGLSAKQVFVGNGSDEVLAHAFVALLKQDKPLLYPDISYSFYPVYCGLFDIDSIKVPLDSNFEIRPEDYKQSNGGIIFPNPNAPTSMALGLDSIEAILRANQESIVVVDEAYVDFGATSAAPLIETYPNLLVVQTLSKSRSLAGLRVGFAMGHPDLIEGLERVKNSFNSYPLGRMEQAGAAAAMQDVEYFEDCCNKVIATRQRTAVELENLGFEVLPSKTNFVFAKPPEKHSAESLYMRLRDEGILVRYFNKPRINEYLRITIGTDSEMDALLAALKTV